MALVTANTIPANQLTAAIRGARRSIYDLYERNQAGLALDDTAYTAYTGVASGDRVVVRDRISGLWTISNNASGGAAALSGLWSRVYDVRIKNIALIDSDASTDAQQFLQLHLALDSQLASIRRFAQQIRDQIDSSQQSVVTSLYGPSGADITTLIDRLESAVRFADNTTGTTLVSQSARMYDVLYQTVAP